MGLPRRSRRWDPSCLYSAGIKWVTYDSPLLHDRVKEAQTEEQTLPLMWALYIVLLLSMQYSGHLYVMRDRGQLSIRTANHRHFTAGLDAAFINTRCVRNSSSQIFRRLAQAKVLLQLAVRLTKSVSIPYAFTYRRHTPHSVLRTRFTILS